MIKRQFYKQEHNDGDGASDSSSSSDSELEPEAAEETEAEDNDASELEPEAAEEEEHKYNEPCSSSSGYESEDSSINEVNADSSGSLTNDDETGTGKDNKRVTKRHSTIKTDEEIEPSNKVSGIFADHPGVNCVLRCKSVFKCRLCPRIVCLSEDTMKVHLKSKRHSRSAKLLSEGRLKLMLNSDGEIEGGDDGETHAERHARTVAAAAAAAENQNNVIKKNKGRQRQRKRLKKKEVKSPKSEEGKQLRKSPAKKRRKSVK